MLDFIDTEARHPQKTEGVVSEANDVEVSFPQKRVEGIVSEANDTEAILKVHEFTFGRFAVHNYLIWDNNTRECVMIDTGDQPTEMLDFITSHELDLKLLLYTHAHIDHIQGHHTIRKVYPDIPVWVHKEENFWIDALPLQAVTYGMLPPKKPEITDYVQDGHVFHIHAHFTIEARFCPGHTPGGISYYVPQVPCVFTGDSLFLGTIGRTDFPRGNHKQLIESIHQQLMTLPDETLVYSGHGPITTIGNERISNPHLR